MTALEPAAVSAEALLKAEQYIEEEEGAANKLKGGLGGFVRLVADGHRRRRRHAAALS